MKVYIDLNPAFGALGERRWALFYRNAPSKCPIRFDPRSWNVRKAAELQAARANNTLNSLASIRHLNEAEHRPR